MARTAKRRGGAISFKNSFKRATAKVAPVQNAPVKNKFQPIRNRLTTLQTKMSEIRGLLDEDKKYIQGQKTGNQFNNDYYALDKLNKIESEYLKSVDAILAHAAQSGELSKNRSHEYWKRPLPKACETELKTNLDRSTNDAIFKILLFMHQLSQKGLTLIKKGSSMQLAEIARDLRNLQKIVQSLLAPFPTPTTQSYVKSFDRIIDKLTRASKEREGSQPDNTANEVGANGNNNARSTNGFGEGAQIVPGQSAPTANELQARLNAVRGRRSGSNGTGSTAAIGINTGKVISPVPGISGVALHPENAATLRGNAGNYIPPVPGISGVALKPENAATLRGNAGNYIPPVATGALVGNLLELNQPRKTNTPNKRVNPNLVGLFNQRPAPPSGNATARGNNSASVSSRSNNGSINNEIYRDQLSNTNSIYNNLNGTNANQGSQGNRTSNGLTNNKNSINFEPPVSNANRERLEKFLTNENQGSNEENNASSLSSLNSNNNIPYPPRPTTRALSANRTKYPILPAKNNNKELNETLPGQVPNNATNRNSETAWRNAMSNYVGKIAKNSKTTAQRVTRTKKATGMFTRQNFKNEWKRRWMNLSPTNRTRKGLIDPIQVNRNLTAKRQGKARRNRPTRKN